MKLFKRNNLAHNNNQSLKPNLSRLNQDGFFIWRLNGK
jgi:hypothetical protein